MSGWIKTHRKLLDNPIVCKDSDHLSIWMYLLLNATHETINGMFKGKRISLEPGQLITGRKSISEFLQINEYKVQRILKLYESEQQIKQQTSNKNRLITIVNWSSYQLNDPPNAQQLHNKCTTTAQQVHTNKNVKNIKNERSKEEILLGEVQNEPKTKNIPYKKIIDYLNEKTGKTYRLVESNKQHIRARFNEGYTEEDFLKVIDNKVAEWLDHEWVDKKGNLVYGKNYLRPATLFGTKFDTYLNQEYQPARKQSHNDFLEMLESGYFDDDGGGIT